MVSANVMARQQLQALEANNVALANMQEQVEKLKKAQEKQLKMQKEATAVLERANEEEEKAAEIAKTRSEASTKLVNALEKENKEFNLLQLNVFETFKNFSKFQEITGQGKFVSILEYTDLILTGTSQKMKVFGIEVATARKVMYGFLPPGMFRLVNQLSTSIRTATGFIRAFKGVGEDTNNIFSNMGKVFRKLPNPKDYMPFGIGKKRVQEQMPTDIFGGLFSEGPTQADLAKKINKKTLFQRVKGATGRAGVKAGIMAQNVRAFAERKGSEIASKAGDKMNKVRDRVFDAMAIAKYIWKNKDGYRLGQTLRGIGKKLNPITAFVKLIKTPMMQALITGMFYLTMIVLVVALITKVVWPALKGAFETFIKFSGILISGFASIWDGVREVFTSLIEGDLLGVMNGLLEIAWGLVKVVFGLLVAVLAGIISFVVNFFVVIFNKIVDFGKKLIADPVATIKKNIGKIALIGLAVIGFFFGLPVMLAGIAIFALFAIGRWIYNKIAGLFDYFAEGGVSSGGMAVVGEKGPELVNLPAGAKVHSNKQSRKMVSSGGGNTINVTVNATSTNDAELRKIAQKVAQMINREVNRTTSSSMSR